MHRKKGSKASAELRSIVSQCFQPAGVEDTRRVGKTKSLPIGNLRYAKSLRGHILQFRGELDHL